MLCGFVICGIGAASIGIATCTGITRAVISTNDNARELLLNGFGICEIIKRCIIIIQCVILQHVQVCKIQYAG